MADLRFPIGQIDFSGALTPEQRKFGMDEVEKAPAWLRDAVAGLSEEQLDTPYRPEGWTVRQVVHHLPDSHLNAYVRLKLALTEDVPTIIAYDEGRWAAMPDSRAAPDVSLRLLEALHERWVGLWRQLTDAEWERQFYHPEMGTMRVDELLTLYAWHGRHHVAHITSLREREGW